MSSGKWRPFCLGLNELTIDKLLDIPQANPYFSFVVLGMMNLQGKTFSHAELKDALKKFKIKREDEAEQVSCI